MSERPEQQQQQPSSTSGSWKPSLVALSAAVVAIMLGQIVSIMDTISALCVKLLALKTNFQFPLLQYVLTYFIVCSAALILYIKGINRKHQPIEGVGSSSSTSLPIFAASSTASQLNLESMAATRSREASPPKLFPPFPLGLDQSALKSAAASQSALGGEGDGLILFHQIHSGEASTAAESTAPSGSVRSVSDYSIKSASNFEVSIEDNIHSDVYGHTQLYPSFNRSLSDASSVGLVSYQSSEWQTLLPPMETTTGTEATEESRTAAAITTEGGLEGPSNAAAAVATFSLPSEQHSPRPVLHREFSQAHQQQQHPSCSFLISLPQSSFDPSPPAVVPPTSPDSESYVHSQFNSSPTEIEPDCSSSSSICPPSSSSVTMLFRWPEQNSHDDCCIHHNHIQQDQTHDYCIHDVDTQSHHYQSASDSHSIPVSGRCSTTRGNESGRTINNVIREDAARAAAAASGFVPPFNPTSERQSTDPPLSCSLNFSPRRCPQYRQSDAPRSDHSPSPKSTDERKSARRPHQQQSGISSADQSPPPFASLHRDPSQVQSSTSINAGSRSEERLTTTRTDEVGDSSNSSNARDASTAADASFTTGGCCSDDGGRRYHHSRHYQRSSGRKERNLEKVGFRKLQQLSDSSSGEENVTICLRHSSSISSMSSDDCQAAAKGCSKTGSEASTQMTESSLSPEADCCAAATDGAAASNATGVLRHCRYRWDRCSSWLWRIFAVGTPAFYILTAFLDVQGGVLTVVAFSYANLASCCLIDWIVLLTAFLLSVKFMGVRPTRWHCVALLAGLAGSLCILVSDSKSAARDVPVIPIIDSVATQPHTRALSIWGSASFLQPMQQRVPGLAPALDGEGVTSLRKLQLESAQLRKQQHQRLLSSQDGAAARTGKSQSFILSKASSVSDVNDETKHAEAVVVFGRRLSVQQQRLFGDVVGLIAAVFLGTTTVMLEQAVVVGIPKAELLFKTFFCAMIISLIEFLIFEAQKFFSVFLTVSLTSWALFGFAAASMSVAYVVTPLVLERSGSAFFNLSLLSSAGFAVLLSALVLGDPFPPLYSVGLVAIMASLFIYHQEKK